MKKLFYIILLIFVIGVGVYFFERNNSQEIGQNINSNTPIFLPSSTPNNLSENLTPTTTMIKEKLSLLTEDGVKIAGIYHKVTDSKIAVLLLHMMPATKESWNKFADFLNKNGYSTLAIDLRGHGENTEQDFQGKRTTLDYRYFSDPEHQKSILDVKAASEFLEKEGFSLISQYIIGASIGSNLAFEFASQYPEVKKIVLLSPGLDYHGLKTEEYLKHITSSQAILAVASESDYYSYNSVKQLAKEAADLKVDFKTIFYKYAGHGTNMFDKETPDLAESILDFLKGQKIKDNKDN